jgi:hypothetical protein
MTLMSAMGRKQALAIHPFLLGFRLLRSPDGGALHRPFGWAERASA